MEPQDYIVHKIEGEYAILKNINDGTEVFIAMALLPAGTDIGTKLQYEYLQYIIVQFGGFYGLAKIIDTDGQYSNSIVAYNIAVFITLLKKR